MATPTMLTEAIAAARSGDRARARELLARLLRSDSANAEYWVWMSAVVDSEQERIQCLESALRLDRTNRAALRGLAILGARTAEQAGLGPPVRLPKRQVAPVLARPKVGRSFDWRLVIGSVVGLLVIVSIGLVGIRLVQPGGFGLAPALAPASATPTATSSILTPTRTSIPAATLVLRTPIPTELIGTPLAYFVDTTPTATPVAGVTPHPDIEAYQAGIAALVAGEYEEALRFMDQVIEIDPRLADAHYFRAEALRSLGQYGRALQAYDRASALELTYAPAFLGRGRTRLLANPEIDPTGDFLTAIHIDPTLIEAYLAASDYYAVRRLWKAMDDMLQAAIDQGITEPILYIRLSEAQYNRTHYAEALESAIEGSGNDPTILEGYLAVGRAYLALRMDSAALWPLQTYTAYRPDDPRGWAQLANAQLAVGDTEMASQSADRALTLNDRHGLAYLVRARIRMQQGDNQGALQDLDRARQYGTTNFALYYAYATAYFNLGNFTQTINSLRDGLTITEDPWEKGEAYALRAMTFEAIDPPFIDDAIANWSWLLDLPGASPDTRAMAEEHLYQLLGGGPTFTPRPTLTATGAVTPTAVGPSPTGRLVTPTRTPTPGPSPTPPPTAGPTETPWVYR